MKEEFEKINTPEKIIPEVVLKIFRHGEKEKDKTKDDADILLTEKGREQAAEMYDPEAENVLAFGATSRLRSFETALRAAFGDEEHSLEEMKEIYKGKYSRDKRLDFKNGHRSPYTKRMHDEYYNGSFLKFLVYESDDYARQTEKDANLKNLDDIQKRGGATYSRMAGQIADVIEKYLKVADNWADVLKNNSNKYNSSKLTRLLGTHQGLGEAFLAKVVDKTAGRQEVDKLIKALSYVDLKGDKRQGFDYAEGMEIDIKKDGADKTIVISFEKDLESGEKYCFKSLVTKEILDEIVKEGEK